MWARGNLTDWSVPTIRYQGPAARSGSLTIRPGLGSSGLYSSVRGWSQYFSQDICSGPETAEAYGIVINYRRTELEGALVIFVPSIRTDWAKRSFVFRTIPRWNERSRLTSETLLPLADFGMGRGIGFWPDGSHPSSTLFLPPLYLFST